MGYLTWFGVRELHSSHGMRNTIGTTRSTAENEVVVVRVNTVQQGTRQAMESFGEGGLVNNDVDSKIY